MKIDANDVIIPLDVSKIIQENYLTVELGF